MPFMSFPSIGQFKDTVRNLKQRVSYRGKNEDGTAIFVPTTAPKVWFLGTIKTHGTNAGVRQESENGELKFQSRNNDITPDSDNCGFAHRMSETVCLKALLAKARLLLKASTDEPVAVYGEWVGKGIQSGVAVATLEKSFILFGARKGDEAQWLTPAMEQFSLLKVENMEAERVFNILDFPHFRVEIDFEAPHLAQEKLAQLTMKVEAECPVGLKLGAGTGTGEGLVWTPMAGEFAGLSSLFFKTKGDKHSVTKVTKIASPDVEKIEGVRNLVASIVTENRLRQGLDMLREKNLPVDVKSTGEFLGWVVRDCLKEETDTIEAAGVDKKAFSSEASRVARVWFLNKLS